MPANQKKIEKVQLMVEEVGWLRSDLARLQAARLRTLNGGGVLMLVLLILGYTKWVPMCALALPFVVIYLIVQYAYLTHRILLRRAHIGALESKINSETGEVLLIGESLDSKESGALGEPHFIGISGISKIGNAVALHFLVLCGIVFLAGALRTSFILAEPELRPVARLADAYFPLLILWSVINIVYLLWHCLTSGEDKDLGAIIRKQFQPKGKSE